MFKNKVHILILVGILIVTGCSDFTKVMKSGTPEQKYEASQKYYEKGDYYHALQLFEELIVLYRGNVKIKTLYFQYANCHFQEGDLELASYHFKYYAKTFPRDSSAQEALYMSAFCKYLISPRYDLDQTATRTAIQEFQNFINFYPNSARVEDANKHIDELRGKLIQKDFEAAKQYYKTEFYYSAISALKQHLKDYPSSPYYEECMFLIIKANFDYAKKSIAKRQVERYTNALAAYNDYNQKYPEGEYAKDAMRIMRMSKTKITDLENK
jgi:outer membrane protein assembly factor BamD